MRTTLDTQEYQHHTARTGSGALLDAVSYNPDVIILDLGLPDMDGVDIIRKIRGWSEMPIIVVSARSEDQDKVEALDAGADDYLTKPFSIDELLARLRAALRRSRADYGTAQQNTAVYHNGSLTIDYAAGCVYLDGEEIHLTPSSINCSVCWPGIPAKCSPTTIFSRKSGAVPWLPIPLRCGSLWLRCARKLKRTPLLPAISRPISEWGIA